MDAFQAARAQAAASAGRDFSIEVRLPHIPLWVEDGPRREMETLVRNTLVLALQEVAGRVSDAAPVSEGILAQSFGSYPATADGGLQVLGANLDAGLTGRVFSSLPYAIVMDEGRRPGAPISRAGIDAIGLWAQRKLGLTAEEAAKAKWAIATSIIAQGIPGTGYFEEGVDRARPTVGRLFDILGGQIVNRLTAEGFAR